MRHFSCFHLAYFGVLSNKDALVYGGMLFQPQRSELHLCLSKHTALAGSRPLSSSFASETFLMRCFQLLDKRVGHIRGKFHRSNCMEHVHKTNAHHSPANSRGR